MLQLALLFSLRRSGLLQRIKGRCGTLNIKVQSYKLSSSFLFSFFLFFSFFFEKRVTNFQHINDIYHKTVANT